MGKIPVRVVDERGASHVVEWTDDDGAVRRRVVMASEIDSGEIDEDVIADAPPYGADWASLDLHIKGADVERALHRRGVWTREDARRNPNAALDALRDAAGLHLSRLTEDNNG